MEQVHFFGTQETFIDLLTTQKDSCSREAIENEARLRLSSSTVQSMGEAVLRRSGGGRRAAEIKDSDTSDESDMGEAREG